MEKKVTFLIKYATGQVYVWTLFIPPKSGFKRTTHYIENIQNKRRKNVILAILKGTKQ